MNIRESIMMSVRNIRRHRLRSALSILSIMLGVAFCTAAFSIGGAGAAYIRSEFETLGENSIQVTVSPIGSSEADRITFEDVGLIKEKVKGVAYASPFMRFRGQIRQLDSEEKQAAEIVAGNQDLQHVFNSGVFSGRYFTQEEFLEARQVALLNRGAAEALFGFENILGRTVEATVNSKRMRLTVIGLLDENEAADSGICLTLPATTLLNTIGGEERSDVCYLVAEDKQAMAQVGQLAGQLLEVRHNNPGKNIYRCENAAQNAQMLARVQGVSDALAAAMAFITLLLGGIGVMSIMLLSVSYRAKEIGIRKALGAKKRNILGQFVIESIILCGIGGASGCVVGVLGSLIMGAALGSPAAFSWHAVLVPLLFSVAVGFIFGIAPAEKAAKLPPVEALRRE